MSSQSDNIHQADLTIDHVLFDIKTFFFFLNQYEYKKEGMVDQYQYQCLPHLNILWKFLPGLLLGRKFKSKFFAEIWFLSHTQKKKNKLKMSTLLLAINFFKNHLNMPLFILD